MKLISMGGMRVGTLRSRTHATGELIAVLLAFLLALGMFGLVSCFLDNVISAF